MFCKNWYLENFHRKALAVGFSYSKLAGLLASNFTGKVLPHKFLPENFPNILRAAFMPNACEQQLLIFNLLYIHKTDKAYSLKFNWFSLDTKEKMYKVSWLILAMEDYYKVEDKKRILLTWNIRTKCIMFKIKNKQTEIIDVVCCLCY